MSPITTGKRTRVTKIYGAENLLVAFNLFMRAVMTSLGLWPPRESDVLRRMEIDAQRMVDQGYRIVSSEHHTLPLGAFYEKVTYELADR